MITLSHQFKGFEYSKFNSYQELVDWMLSSGVLNNSQVQVHDLGESSMAGANLYGFSYGSLNKPMLYLEYQIHGRHEWRCTHYGFKFFEKFVLGEFGHEIKRIMGDFCLFIFPSLNPYGYENGEYGNANGVNLQRNFDFMWEESGVPTIDEVKQNGIPGAWYGTSKGNAPFDQPETAAVKKIVEQYRPILFCDFHTRGENSIGSFLPGNKINTNYNKPLFRELAYAYRKHTGTGIAYTDSGGRNEPTSDAWAASLRTRMGTQTMAMTLETPELVTDVERSFQGFTLSLLSILYATKYYKNRYMTQR